MKDLAQCREEINRIDEAMARLFEERMRVAEQVAAYKKEHGLPVYDAEREKAVLERNSSFLSAEELKPYYRAFQEKVMEVSRAYQTRQMEE